MFRIAVFTLLLFAIAFGFAWLADRPGAVTVEWDWFDQGKVYEFGLISLMVALAIVVAALMIVWVAVTGIINFPKTFGRWRAGRRRDKGYAALSKGLVAAGAGNAPLAKQLAKESSKLLENEPLVAMLDAQTALLDGNHSDARKKFETMLGNDETRLLGLRGLYVEAEQEGQMEAAAHFAMEANTHTPGTPWAAKAVLKVQTISGEWEEALRTLNLNRSAGLYEKEEFTRKKAVILTAQAMQEEDTNPDNAKSHALAAHKLAPDLTPAAVVAARLSVRLNDTRKATKVLEAAWKQQPHPEIADAYVNLKPGDTSAERLKRAEKLATKLSSQNAEHIESHYAVAKAAIDATEFPKARKAMEAALRSKPTERACLLMADIEEAEHGDRGRVREWLSRAVSATKDTVWIADGIIADQWAPLSPVTGRLDAFEWKEPMELLGGAGKSMDYSQLVNLPPVEDIIELDEITADDSARVVTDVELPQKPDLNEVEDAEVIDADATPATPENDNAEKATPSAVKPEKPKLKVVADEVKASPFRPANLDTDEDGVIDHRPDDPGVNEQQPEKKGWLF